MRTVEALGVAEVGVAEVGVAEVGVAEAVAVVVVWISASMFLLL